MHKRLIIFAAGSALSAAALLAQIAASPQVGGQNFQQASTLGRGGELIPVIGRTVTGSPYSATEERRTVQTLGDGTVLETSETNILYRDSQGRTRVEHTQQGRTTITIVDPEAHTTVRLDPVSKTARKAMGGAFGAGVMTGGGDGAAGWIAGSAELASRGRGAIASTMTESDRRVEELRRALTELNAASTPQRTKTEDLGMLHRNGVPAQGTRTTLTIPVGQIGNNREIRVVNERWYSQDLQMVVKSVNSDPRFGTTTYELRNIARTNPDASLFQIPNDYTTVEGGARRGGR